VAFAGSATCATRLAELDALQCGGAAVKRRGQVFKVIIKYPDGTREEDDEVFESESEATEYGLNQVSNHETGGEVLHLSNPGDYPLSDDDTADFEVIEV
jgi:hypothetical protein